MAEKKKRRVVKPAQTVRERATKLSEAKPKTRRLRNTAGRIGRPLKTAHRVGKKEFYLPMPDNRLGRFLNKRRRLFPSFFIDAWRELRSVTWPNGRETASLTLAVFVFATFLSAIITLSDFGLDKIFKQLLLN